MTMDKTTTKTPPLDLAIAKLPPVLSSHASSFRASANSCAVEGGDEEALDGGTNHLLHQVLANRANNATPPPPTTAVERMQVAHGDKATAPFRSSSFDDEIQVSPMMDDDDVEAAAPQAPQFAYDERGQVAGMDGSKGDLPPGAPRPGAYSGAPASEYDRVRSARLSLLGLEASDAEQATNHHSRRHHRLSQEELQEQANNAQATASREPKGKCSGKACVIFQSLVCAFVVGAIVVVPLALLFGNKDKNGDHNNNDIMSGNATSSSPQMEDILPLLPNLPLETRQAILENQPGSPQVQAYAWLASTTADTMDALQDWQREERFAMAVFFYSMGEWDSTWLEQEDFCNSPTVACDPEGHVTMLNMTKTRGFKGQLPLRELNLLPRLTRLDFSNNFLGSLADTWGSGTSSLPGLQEFYCTKCRLESDLSPTLLGRFLPNLKKLVLNDNDITGTVPETQLEHLELQKNQLQGELRLPTMPSLTSLNLRENQLTSVVVSGTTPNQQLTHLDLGSNQIHQALPSQLGAWTGLTRLLLDYNALTGMLPTQLPPNLRLLQLDTNQLSGSLPETLFEDLTYLKAMILRGNKIEGTISSEVGRLTDLQIADFSSNRLVGPIPSQIGLLDQLHILHFETNQLSGVLPTELVRLRALEKFTIKDNNGMLTGNLPTGFCALPKLSLLRTDWCTSKESCCV